MYLVIQNTQMLFMCSAEITKHLFIRIESRFLAALAQSTDSMPDRNVDSHVQTAPESPNSFAQIETEGKASRHIGRTDLSGTPPIAVRHNIFRRSYSISVKRSIRRSTKYEISPCRNSHVFRILVPMLWLRRLMS